VKVTQTAVVVGTPRYMSPEQAKAESLDERSDIYSLGACFYHLFAGEAPFDADTPVALMMKHVADPLVPLRRRAPSVPSGVASIVERMLAKQPADRYQGYDELLDDVEAARRGRLGTLASPAAMPTQAAAPARSSWAVPVALLIAAAVGFVALGISKASRRVAATVPASGENAPPPAAAPAEAPKDGGGAAPIPASWNVNGMIGMALQTKTLATLRKLATMCEVWMSEHDGAPEALVEVFDHFDVPREERRDGWAHPIRYEKTARGKFRLLSDGPDGRAGTDDDIVMENASVVQGGVSLPGVPTLRQQRGLDPPPRPVEPE